MKINNTGLNQTFRGNNENNRSFMGQLTDVIDDTAKKTGDIADFVVAAKSAIDSPEEATVRVLNNHLENVVNSKKAPEWIKKPAMYLAAASLSALYFVGLRKAPGKITGFTKKLLLKTQTGTSVVNFLGTMKSSVAKLADSLKIKSEILDMAKGKMSGALSKATAFMTEKFPKVSNAVNHLLDLTKIKTWTKKDYIANSLAGFIAASYGKDFIDKHSAKDAVKKPEQKDEVPSMRDAA